MSQVVQGYDFEAAVANGAVDWTELSNAFGSTGLQASEVANAVRVIKEMFRVREATGEKLILAFTSNLISSGLREIFTEMARKKMIDLVVTTAGGVEEDFIKCLGPTVLGDFSLDGATLRSKGLNRIANLLVPNDNYCKFEEFLLPLLTNMKKKQDETGVAWSPASMIDYLGEKIADATSFYNQCHENGIPVVCPSLSDGSIGDMLFFHAFKEPGLVLDSAVDLGLAADTIAAGGGGVNLICLGGGLPKYHSLMAAKLANSEVRRMVLVNTGLQYDGSETGKSMADDTAAGRLPTGMWRAEKVNTLASSGKMCQF